MGLLAMQQRPGFVEKIQVSGIDAGMHCTTHNIAAQMPLANDILRTIFRDALLRTAIGMVTTKPGAAGVASSTFTLRAPAALRVPGVKDVGIEQHDADKPGEQIPQNADRPHRPAHRHRASGHHAQHEHLTPVMRQPPASSAGEKYPGGMSPCPIAMRRPARREAAARGT